MLLAVSGCTKSYPYLFLTDNCRCEEYTYHDQRQQFDIIFKAHYEVDERVVTTVDIEFRNHSRDTLSLQQAYLKGTSRNIKYQYNNKWVPMPFEAIPPGDSYTMTFRGGDTEMISDPWQKIAGERTVLEIKSLMLGKTMLDPIRVELAPTNPMLLM
ncbi:MAG: hypothetical protein L0Y80_01210 [Ignavibacteriae bacterium]|nr:hypothetical protein [Ignavibacteriota bacterium]